MAAPDRSDPLGCVGSNLPQRRWPGAENAPHGIRPVGKGWLSGTSTRESAAFCGCRSESHTGRLWIVEAALCESAGRAKVQVAGFCAEEPGVFLARGPHGTRRVVVLGQAVGQRRETGWSPVRRTPRTTRGRKEDCARWAGLIIARIAGGGASSRTLILDNPRWALILG
jgi:hypothetical protein